MLRFLLFSIENDRSIRIELLAVSGQFQKQRIGEGAIRILEKFAVTNDNSVIKVGTQLEKYSIKQLLSETGIRFLYQVIQFIIFGVNNLRNQRC